MSGYMVRFVSCMLAAFVCGVVVYLYLRWMETPEWVPNAFGISVSVIVFAIGWGPCPDISAPADKQRGRG